jgi:chromate transporter
MDRNPTQFSIQRWTVGCFKIGALSIGASGRSLLFRRWVVDEASWLTAEEFQEIFTITQIFPGPNLVNLAVYLGHRLGKWRAALLGLLALVLPGTLMILLLAAFLPLDHPSAIKFLVGASLASFGLFGVLILQMLPSLREGGALSLKVLLVLGVIVASLAGVPVELCLFVGGIVSIILLLGPQVRRR